MRKIKKIFIVGLFIQISVVSFAQTSINWEIGFVKISYNRYSGISVTASAGITTPIGRFSIDYTQDLSKRRESSNVVYVDRIKIQKQDLVVVIRDKNKNIDNLYKIENGANLEVTTTGKTNVIVEEGMVTVNITDVDDCVILFNRNKTYSSDNANKAGREADRKSEEARLLAEQQRQVAERQRLAEEQRRVEEQKQRQLAEEQRQLKEDPLGVMKRILGVSDIVIFFDMTFSEKDNGRGLIYQGYRLITDNELTKIRGVLKLQNLSSLKNYSNIPPNRLITSASNLYAGTAIKESYCAKGNYVYRAIVTNTYKLNYNSEFYFLKEDELYTTEGHPYGLCVNCCYKSREDALRLGSYDSKYRKGHIALYVKP